jgi:uncharacterized protein
MNAARHADQPAGRREEEIMAFAMSGTVSLKAEREKVWASLNDPAVLRASIPGCQSLEQTEDGGFNASVKIKVGPIAATFKGRVMLEDLDPPNGYRLSGQGEGGIAGHAKGSAKVQLTDGEEPGTCLLSYTVEANVGGKIAQLGSRLIDGVAKKTADQFFANFAAEVQPEVPAA